MMNTTIAVRCRDRNGTYITNKVQGKQASCSVGRLQAVNSLAKKLFPGREVTIRSIDQENWTITPDPIFNTIEFFDGGQDFTQWVLKDGYVIDSQPFQARIWVGCEVKMVDRTVFVRRPASEKFSRLNYLAESVSDTDQAYVQGFLDFENSISRPDPDEANAAKQYRYGYNVAKALLATS